MNVPHPSLRLKEGLKEPMKQPPTIFNKGFQRDWDKFLIGI